ncbi:MAG: hypothetical protein AAF705_12370 [Bacteroidota bacterium]
MANKILGFLLISVFAVMATGFYYIYSGDMDNYVFGQKLVGIATVCLFFGVMPIFLIVRYRDKKLKSFIWNPDALGDDEEE